MFIVRKTLIIALTGLLVSACKSGLSNVGGIGKSVAYFDQEGDQWELVIENRWKNETHRITIPAAPRGRPLFLEQEGIVVFATDAGLFLADADAESSWQVADSLLSEPFVSIDGRFIVFASASDTLVDDDTNGVADVFVYDRIKGAMSRASILSDQSQSSMESSLAGVSADGRYVVFRSGSQIFIRDTMKSLTTTNQ